MFELIIKLDEKFNYGIDLYHSIWNNLAIMGGMYIDIIEKREEDPIFLSELLQNNKHTKKIHKEKLFDIIIEIKNALVGENNNGQFSVPKPLWKGVHFWEYLLEKIRATKYPNNISRLSSYFLFKV
jgi:hypothetical protein